MNKKLLFNNNFLYSTCMIIFMCVYIISIVYVSIFYLNFTSKS